MKRRNFQATEEQRRMVKSLAGFGLKQEHIAPLVGVASTTTLRKYFREELEQGPVEAHANVRGTLFKLATSGRNPGATMFWLKRRAGWSENGRPPEPEKTSEEHTCRVIVHQPPRSPDDQKAFEDARRDLSQFGNGQPEEWEELPSP
jgi:hypothetical protein